MKRLYTSFFIAILLLSGCSKVADESYEELILGTWLNTHVNETAVETDAAYVMEFREGGIEFYSTGYQIDENNRKWIDGTQFSYSFNNNQLVISGTNSFDAFFEMVFVLEYISKTKYIYKVGSFKINGIDYPDEKVYTCTRVSNDLKSSITGTWYGKSTEAGSADTAFHYWQYFDNGSYDYFYRNEEGNWINKPDNEGKYYLYGNHLATNFTNDLISGGTGLAYECWEVSINGNTMNWTGRRSGGRIASYSMQRVSSPPISGQ